MGDGEYVDGRWGLKKRWKWEMKDKKGWEMGDDHPSTGQKASTQKSTKTRVKIIFHFFCVKKIKIHLKITVH